MTREEKIWELVDKYWKEDEMCRSDLFDFAKEIIAIDEWISVEDEMPTPNMEVLVYDSEFYRTIVGWVFRDRSGWDSYADNYNITHWRPLPKPPKGE